MTALDAGAARRHQRSTALVYRLEEIGQQFAQSVSASIPLPSTRRTRRSRSAAPSHRDAARSLLPNKFDLLRLRLIDGHTHGFDAFTSGIRAFDRKRAHELSSIIVKSTDVWQRFLLLVSQRNPTSGTRTAIAWLEENVARATFSSLPDEDLYLLHHHLLHLRSSVATPGYAPEALLQMFLKRPVVPKMLLTHHWHSQGNELASEVFWIDEDRETLGATRFAQEADTKWLTGDVREFFESDFSQFFTSTEQWDRYYSRRGAVKAAVTARVNRHLYLALWVPVFEDAYDVTVASFRPLGAFIGWLVGFVEGHGFQDFLQYAQRQGVEKRLFDGCISETLTPDAGDWLKKVVGRFSLALDAAIEPFRLRYHQFNILDRLRDNPVDGAAVDYLISNLEHLSGWQVNRPPSPVSTGSVLRVNVGGIWPSSHDDRGAALDLCPGPRCFQRMTSADKHGEAFHAEYVERKAREVQNLFRIVEAAWSQQQAGVSDSRDLFAHEVRKVADAFGSRWLMPPPSRMCLPHELVELMPFGWKLAPLAELQELGADYVSLFADDAGTANLCGDSFGDDLAKSWELAFTASVFPALKIHSFQSTTDPYSALASVKGLLEAARTLWMLGEWVSTECPYLQQNWSNFQTTFRGGFTQLLTSVFREVMMHGDRPESGKAVELAEAYGTKKAITITVLDYVREIRPDDGTDATIVLNRLLRSESQGRGHLTRMGVLRRLNGTHSKPPDSVAGVSQARSFSEIYTVPFPGLG